MNRTVSNRKQLERMVELMEESPGVARGMLAKADLAKKWESIAVELNSLGPPQRDSSKWQRVWIDQKTKIKKKLTNNKIEITATGGGSNNLIRLTDTEEAVSRIMNFQASVDPPGVEFGLVLPDLTVEGQNAEEDETVQVEAEMYNLVQSPKPSQQRCTNKEKNEKKRLALLENQTSAQEIFYDKMIDVMYKMDTRMENIQKSIQNTEYYAKKSYSLKKEKKSEILKIKKEKLLLYKENIINKENDRKTKLNLKKKLLEIEQAKQNLMSPYIPI